MTSSKPTHDWLIDRLTAILAEHTGYQSVAAAEVKVFMGIMRPEADAEKPYFAGTRGMRWEWDYADRLIYCLLKYLPLGPADQKVIREASAEGIYWRGEPVSDFKDICAHTRRMRTEGAEVYTEQGQAKLESTMQSLKYTHRPSNERAKE